MLLPSRTEPPVALVVARGSLRDNPGYVLERLKLTWVWGGGERGRHRPRSAAQPPVALVVGWGSLRDDLCARQAEAHVCEGREGRSAAFT